MKLLIADDENLTREGLIHSLDWKSLGITQILQADDGENGYHLALNTPPDIVLTDVRMPRMNGIEMSEKIQQLNPDCSIIFMSGYSDKEYLKAAIKLKAVRYVEKPIDAAEVTEAIREAASMLSEKKRHVQTQVLFQKEATSRLALMLTKPGAITAQSTEVSLEGLPASIHSSTYFTTIIIRFKRLLSDFKEQELTELSGHMDTLTEENHLHQIHTLKNEAFFILHLFGNQRPSHYTLEKICRKLQTLLTPHKHFFLVVGKTVMGPEKVFQSYQSAVILLQNAFFCPYGSILYPEVSTEVLPLSLAQINTLTETFYPCLLEKNLEQTKQIALKLYERLLCNRSLLVNQVKDLYYKMISFINSAIYQLKLSGTFSASTEESLMELVGRCDILDELHQLLLRKIQDFQELLEMPSSENATVFLIRDYISKHYMNESLSIKDISEHVHLSSSYICTIFKTETGQTLNQYITEFRIEKAKQLLADSRNKITEISAKVGYADGNYFSKSFKKTVGLSPSEYRERELL